MKITHDFHIHTHLSQCAKREATVEGYIEWAKKLGIKKLGFSDHIWENTPDNYERVEKILPELENFKNEGIKLYYGCEPEYRPELHGIVLPEEEAEKFDFIVAPNSHTHLCMPKNLYEPYEKHAEFMINAYNEILDCPSGKYVTAMAHPFEAVCCPYDYTILMDLISDDTYKRLFDKTARRGVAVEINVASMKKKSHEEIERASEIRLFKLAKECGCKFIFGSDAHFLEAHQTYSNADLVASLLELKESDIIELAL